MADGDDREENEHNKRDDTPDVQIGNLMQLVIIFREEILI